jgi:hypothetical protein
MKDVQENVLRWSEKVVEIQSHPMCGRFLDEGQRLIVVYPAGDFGVGYDGLRCSVSVGGKLAAATKLLNIMERDWKQSFPGSAI